jgi:hypothetical protein
MNPKALKFEVEAMFEVVRDRSSDTELVFICPVPGCGDKSGNRSVNLKTGKTNCWRCGQGGDFVKWAKFLGYEVDGSLGGAGIDEVEGMLKLLEPKREVITPVATGVQLPKGFTLLSKEPHGVYTDAIESMANRKNLELHDFVEVGAGFTRYGAWEPYCVFPVYEFGRLVYYQGRTYAESPGERSKKFPSRKELPLGARYWVYNIDALADPGVTSALVVESILNVLSLKKEFKALGIKHVVPIAVFKHKVSRPQFAKILRFSNLKELCLLFDRDATALSWQSAPQIINRIRLTVAEMPYVAGKKTLDPNDDVVAAVEAFRSRKDYRFSTDAALKLRQFEESLAGGGTGSKNFDIRSKSFGDFRF